MTLLLKLMICLLALNYGCASRVSETLLLYFDQYGRKPSETLTILKDMLQHLDIRGDDYSKERNYVQSLIDVSNVNESGCNINRIAQVNHKLHMILGEHVKQYIWHFRNEQLKLCKELNKPIKELTRLTKDVKADANLLYDLFNASGRQLYDVAARLGSIAYLRTKSGSDQALTSTSSKHDIRNLFYKYLAPLCMDITSKYSQLQYDIELEDFKDFDKFGDLSFKWSKRILLCKHILYNEENFISQIRLELSGREDSGESSSDESGEQVVDQAQTSTTNDS